MVKRPTLKEKLARLAELAKGRLSAETAMELRKALSGASNALAARAADVAAKLEAAELIPDLVAAFGRFMDNPEKTDKGCTAKTAEVKALVGLGYDEDGVLLRGIRHVQMEPVYGGRADTAANLRAECAMGLVRIGHPDTLFELTTLLMDGEPQPRRAAVKALAYLGAEPCELLLRIKVLAGDPEPDVIGDCFAGLIGINAERSMPFVSEYLASDDEVVAESAAIALGESRKPEAFQILRDHWEDALRSDRRKTLLLPMALTRCDEAFEFLLEVVLDRPPDYAIAAVKALKIFAHDEGHRRRIRKSVEERDEFPITEAYKAEFGRKD